MPQIANQDYNVIRLGYAVDIFDDASALAQVAAHIERGTIFDAVVEISDSVFARPVGTCKRGTTAVSIGYFDTSDGTTGYVDILHSPTQYEGLAAVQVACELTENLPGITTSINGNVDACLTEDNTGNLLCVDGKLVKVSDDDNSCIALLTVTDDSPTGGADWVNVQFDDLQKLIGLALL